jgi:hypothetical protein
MIIAPLKLNPKVVAPPKSIMSIPIDALLLASNWYLHVMLPTVYVYMVLINVTLGFPKNAMVLVVGEVYVVPPIVFVSIETTIYAAVP